jgi:Tfp pilus assembly protein PilV
MITTKQQHNGITLLEVLASIFVVSIGLLGVLAVIPFGAYQASQARHAEYAANMLANAAEEVYVRDMAKPLTWGFNTGVLPSHDVFTSPQQWTETVKSSSTISGGTRETTTTIDTTTTVSFHPRIQCFGIPVLMDVKIEIDIEYETVIADTITPNPPVIRTIPGRQRLTDRFTALNCTRFIWFEPRERAHLPGLAHIFPLSTFQPVTGREALIRKWEEPMRGQDDLDYTTYADKRPDFAVKNDEIQSFGKYSWFFTFSPMGNGWVGTYVDRFGRCHTVDLRTGQYNYVSCNGASENLPFNAWWGDGAVVRLDDVGCNATVDVLACHNRVPDADRQISIPDANFSPSSRGGAFIFPNADHLELLTQTKYVFVTWGMPVQAQGGAWCKVVFVDKSNPTRPKVVVTSDSTLVNDNMRVYIPNGIMYHKRLKNVPIK